MEQWEVNAYLSDIELNIKNGNIETALDGLNALSTKLYGTKQNPSANTDDETTAAPCGCDPANHKICLRHAGHA